jgi:exodeoxyribonuclease VIII
MQQIKTMENLQQILAEKENKLFLADVDEKIYRKHSAIAQSDLKTLLDFSCQHYLRNKVRLDQKETDAKTLGKLIHTVVFEPERLNEYTIMPDYNARTKKGKDQIAEFKDEARLKGQTIIKQDQRDTAERVIESISKKEHVLPLIRKGVREMSMFWPYADLVMKARMDYYLPESNTIVDLKSTKCAQMHIFSRDIIKYRYHIQAAYYSDIVEFHTGQRPTFIIIAVETFAPWEVAIYKMGRDMTMIGRAEYTKGLAILAEAQSSNVWPGYPGKVQTMKAPKFLWDQYCANNIIPSATTAELKVKGERTINDRPQPPPF